MPDLRKISVLYVKKTNNVIGAVSMEASDPETKLKVSDLAPTGVVVRQINPNPAKVTVPLEEIETSSVDYDDAILLDPQTFHFVKNPQTNEESAQQVTPPATLQVSYSVATNNVQIKVSDNAGTATVSEDTPVWIAIDGDGLTQPLVRSGTITAGNNHLDFSVQLGGGTYHLLVLAAKFAPVLDKQNI